MKYFILMISMLAGFLNVQVTEEHYPVLLLIGGFQGAGKTTLIEKIQKTYDIRVVSTDAIRQQMIDQGGYTHEQFVQSVKDTSENQIKAALKERVHLVVDANAHAKRISEINNLAQETPYTVLKIYLRTSEETLKQRIAKRLAVKGQYQGTEADLMGSLASSKIDLTDYDLVIDTDKWSEKEIFQQTKAFLSPHFSLQSTSLYPLIRKNPSLLPFIEYSFQRLKNEPPLGDKREIEHALITSIDEQKLEPKRRCPQLGVDRSATHPPYPENEFKLKNGALVSASILNFSDLAPECPKMIASQAPLPENLDRFWAMIDESNSHLIVMLTGFIDEVTHKVKCTRYWPENIGETVAFDNERTVTLVSAERIGVDGEKELWRSRLQLKSRGQERFISHYWLKGWKDGEALDSYKLQSQLLAEMHTHILENPSSIPLIHCSAGIGRTGTIVGTYLVQYHLNKLQKSDTLPFELTLYLRFQRSHMIHTLNQYKGFCDFIGWTYRQQKMFQPSAEE